MRNTAKVKEFKQLWERYYRNNLFPESWVPQILTETDIIQSIAVANGKDLSAASDIMNNMSAYANSETKNKIVGRLGKLAVCNYYNFSPERLFGRKRGGGFDFHERGYKIVVKSTGYMRGEVMMLDAREIDSDDGPDIYVYAIVDYDIESISCVAHLAGWLPRGAIDNYGVIAEDVKGSPLCVPLLALKPPRALGSYISMFRKE